VLGRGNVISIAQDLATIEWLTTQERDTMRATNAGGQHFTVTVRRTFDRTDADRTFTMSAHTLTLTPDGHLSIERQYQRLGRGTGLR
jgi:hypothetical protein